jgi:acetolactate synthase-1/2/3 large subunit
MTREQLDVIVVIYANCSSGILNIEVQPVGASGNSVAALSMLDVHNSEVGGGEDC